MNKPSFFVHRASTLTRNDTQHIYHIMDEAETYLSATVGAVFKERAAQMPLMHHCHWMSSVVDTGRHNILYLFHGMSAIFHLMSLPTTMAPCTDKN
jgi:hypothetical protein